MEEVLRCLHPEAYCDPLDVGVGQLDPTAFGHWQHRTSTSLLVVDLILILILILITHLPWNDIPIITLIPFDPCLFLPSQIFRRVFRLKESWSRGSGHGCPQCDLGRFARTGGRSVATGHQGDKCHVSSYNESPTRDLSFTT